METELLAQLRCLGPAVPQQCLGEACELGQTRKDPCEQAPPDAPKAAVILEWTVCGADMKFYIFFF